MSKENEEALVLEELIEGNEDLEWFTNNYNKLQKKCSNNFIAIKDKKIIHCEPKLNELIDKIRKKKKNPSDFLIDYVYAKEDCLVV